MKNRLWVIALFSLSAAVLASINALKGPFVLDDITKVVENTDIRQLSNLPGKLVYPYHVYQVLQRNDPSRPVVYFFYTLLYAVDGLNPFVFRLLNVLAHGLCIGFLYWISRLWLSGWAAAAVAALFAWAPIQMGTVIYVYGLSDVLSAAGTLAALAFYYGRSRWRVPVSCFFFLLALFCKQSAIVLPALILITDYFLFHKTRWKEYIPYAVIAAGYLLFRGLYFGGVGDLEGYSQPHTLWNYLTCEPWVMWQYLIRAFVPWHLAIDHYLMPFHLSGAMRFASALLWLPFLAGVAYLYRKAPQDPWNRLLMWGLAWFLIVLIPVSSFFPTVDLMVERRVYLANVGLYSAFVGWIYFRFPREVNFKKSLLAAVALFSLVFTWMRNEDFQTAEGLWMSVLKVYPTSQRGLNSLSTIYMNSGQYDKATRVFEETLRLYPTDHLAAGNYGSMLAADENPNRNYDRALELFHRSLQFNPNVAETPYNIGRILQLRGRGRESIPYYERTLQLKPNYVPALNNIAAVFLAEGNVTVAKPLLEKALSVDPTYVPAQQNMRVILEGKAPQAPKKK